jgi:enoyl-[acyl-carrier protein] reductase II
MPSNRVCQALNIERPIIQGPMAWTSTAALVAAVSNSGGLGVLGVGFAPPEFIRSQVQETLRMTARPFGLNVFVIPEMLESRTDIIREERPPVVYADTLVDLDYELSKKYFSTWHDMGAKIIVKASTVKDAVTAEKAGADVVVVKGWEGGGHVTPEATMVLVPQAADRVSIPLIASGGIADGRGMAAAIALGAEGIEMGTAFLAATETPIPQNVKESVVAAEELDTVITGYCTDEPCRQIRNKLSDDLVAIEARYTRTEAADRLRDVAISSLRKAMVEGDLEEGAIMAGQTAVLVKQIRTVQQIMDAVLVEYERAVERLKAFPVR